MHIAQSIVFVVGTGAKRRLPLPPVGLAVGLSNISKPGQNIPGARAQLHGVWQSGTWRGAHWRQYLIGLGNIAGRNTHSKLAVQTPTVVPIGESS